MSKNKRRDTNLQLEAKSVIVPIIILTIFAVLIGMTVVNGVSFQSKTFERDSRDSMSVEDEIWQKAFLEAEKNKVGVIFEPINTTEEEYTSIRVKCNEFIESNQEGKKVDANVSVDTIVDEKRYIDGETDNKVKTEQISQDFMSETGPIYFQDMLMIRYINTEGQLKVITGAFNKDKSGILVTRQSDLIETMSSINESKDNSKDSSSEANNTWVSEEVYLDNISETLEQMLLARSTEEIREAESLALNYFTAEGKKTVFGNRESIKLSEGSDINTIYIGAGKSDSSKTYKDRIYTQLKIKVGTEEFFTYIILKLNSNLRIYDIDIV